jgi:NADPH-dependent 7-cyano-7-deazaguanine reductase QueF
VSADPGLLRTVEEWPGLTVTAKAGLVHRCPHVEEVDVGTVEVSWYTNGHTVELHSLAAYLVSWAEARVSHEEVTEQIRRDLAGLEGIAQVRVMTSWSTAGLAVSVGAAIIR